jgi:hypothetical protein
MTNTDKRRIVGWRVRNPNPQPATSTTAPKPKPDPYEQQKERWAKEKQEVESPSQSPWGEKEKPHQLLDDIPDNLSPEERQSVLITRIENMLDS